MEMLLTGRYVPAQEAKELDVSEFLQLVGNMAFFVAIHVGKPHGMMESWNVGILGMKSGKRSILKKCCIYIL
jgi:hypothetical protein